MFIGADVLCVFRKGNVIQTKCHNEELCPNSCPSLGLVLLKGIHSAKHLQRGCVRVCTYICCIVGTGFLTDSFMGIKSCVYGWCELSLGLNMYWGLVYGKWSELSYSND